MTKTTRQLISNNEAKNILGFTDREYKQLRTIAYRLRANSVATLSNSVINLAFELRNKGFDIQVVKDSYITYVDERYPEQSWTYLNIAMYKSSNSIVRRYAHMHFETSEQLDNAIALRIRLKRVFESLDFESRFNYTISFNPKHNRFVVTHENSRESLRFAVDKHCVNVLARDYDNDEDLLDLQLNDATQLFIGNS